MKKNLFVDYFGLKLVVDSFVDGETARFLILDDDESDDCQPDIYS